MRISLRNQNQSFSGYKNVIGDMYDKAPISRFSFLSMQLDNNGTPDLDIWKTIQKDLYKIKDPQDVITFQCVEIGGLGKKFYFGGNSLNLKTVNSKNEALILKAFGLIASLTKRIIMTSLPTVDREMPKTILQTRENFLKFLENDADFVDNIIYTSVQSRFSKSHIAENMNKNVHKMMKAYLK